MPAVCIGGNSGRPTYSCVTVEAPPVLRFDTRRCNPSVTISGGLVRSEARAETIPVRNVTSTKWFTVLASHPGASNGPHGSPVLNFAVRIESAAGGLAIGVVDPRRFRASSHNLGAADASWALSRSGKKSDGSPIGWQAYTGRLSVDSSTTIGCSVDLRPGVGTISFWVNDIHLGVAFAGLDTESGLVLVPAVCLGASGHRSSVVELIPWVPPAEASTED